MPYVLAWLKAFALTALIEASVGAYLLRDDEPHVGRRIGLLIYAQLASHPAVWFIFPRVIENFDTMVVVAEAWAVLSEALFFVIAFPKVGPVRALGVAALNNGLSFGAGLVLRRFGLV